MFAIAAIALSTAFAGAQVTHQEVVDSFCVLRTPRPHITFRECFQADFTLHEVLTPSGVTVYRWEGERSRQLYRNGVLVDSGELDGIIFLLSQDGVLHLEHRDTCFYVFEDDVYLSGRLTVVDGRLVHEDLGEVESCD